MRVSWLPRRPQAGDSIKSNSSRWSKFDPLYEVIGGGVKIFSSPKHNSLQQFPYFASQPVGPTIPIRRAAQTCIFLPRRAALRSKPSAPAPPLRLRLGAPPRLLVALHLVRSSPRPPLANLCCCDVPRAAWTPPRDLAAVLQFQEPPAAAAAPHHQLPEMAGDMQGEGVVSRGTPLMDPLRLLPACSTHQARCPPWLPSPTSAKA
jgi:hypothetical protein